jgi:hypothetical protein
MSIADFYVHKAAQCERLAAVATDPRERVKYENEGGLWRKIAKDIARQDRDEGLPP